MKNINEFLINKKLVKREIINKLSDDDKHNFEEIANAIDEITNEISIWVDKDEDKRENTATYTLARSLSNLASQLRGEWPEEITFYPYEED